MSACDGTGGFGEAKLGASSTSRPPLIPFSSLSLRSLEHVSPTGPLERDDRPLSVSLVCLTRTPVSHPNPPGCLSCSSCCTWRVPYRIISPPRTSPHSRRHTRYSVRGEQGAVVQFWICSVRSAASRPHTLAPLRDPPSAPSYRNGNRVRIQHSPAKHISRSEPQQAATEVVFGSRLLWRARSVRNHPSPRVSHFANRILRASKLTVLGTVMYSTSSTPRPLRRLPSTATIARRSWWWGNRPETYAACLYQQGSPSPTCIPHNSPIDPPRTHASAPSKRRTLSYRETQVSQTPKKKNAQAPPPPSRPRVELLQLESTRIHL